jgi:putative oxidoreductase
MTTATATHHDFEPSTQPGQRLVGHKVTRYAVPVGRVLFVLIFLIAGPHHFSGDAIAHAQANGVPMAQLLVPLSGVLALLGGLSVALGLKARFGALLLAAFLLPVTLMMHRFWSIDDPQQAMLQQVMFMKNMSMLGAALMLSHFGAGQVSIDQRVHHRRNEDAYRRAVEL